LCIEPTSSRFNARWSNHQRARAADRGVLIGQDDPVRAEGHEQPGPSARWWIVWVLVSAVWLWCFVLIGEFVAHGGITDTDPSATDRVEGAVWAAIGCAGPVLSLLVSQSFRTAALKVAMAAIAAAAVGATFICLTTAP
jgi:hypothetical protein